MTGAPRSAWPTRRAPAPSLGLQPVPKPGWGRRRGPGEDLFAGAAAERSSPRTAPLAARMRPRTLDEIVGQRHLVGPGAPLRALIEADRLDLGHPLGPAGHGQDDAGPRGGGTATAKHFVPLSAVRPG